MLSIDTEKAFEQIHDKKKKHVKILLKYSTNWDGKELPPPGKQHVKKPTVNIILNPESLKAFQIRPGKRCSF